MIKAHVGLFPMGSLQQQRMLLLAKRFWTVNYSNNKHCKVNGTLAGFEEKKYINLHNVLMHDKNSNIS
jgi:hypothetical protein